MRAGTDRVPDLRILLSSYGADASPLIPFQGKSAPKAFLVPSLSPNPDQTQPGLDFFFEPPPQNVKETTTRGRVSWDLCESNPGLGCGGCPLLCPASPHHPERRTRAFLPVQDNRPGFFPSPRDGATMSERTVCLGAPLLPPAPASACSLLFNCPREKIVQFFCPSSLGEGSRINTGEATCGALAEKRGLCFKTSKGKTEKDGHYLPIHFSWLVTKTPGML